ncbi:MAG: hypothetical protein ABJN39_09285 [Sulfitobacter sp.]|uniref:hypothetical protein n=1 Tax=Alphaproteobacteria TaxID=28211 RepID=UPI002942A40E|nr:hypothetical protein [Sulfitobacter sp. LC.270.F.C4]WOI13567.1 hypothetical protein R1T45_01685 [Sulfitobacter sp. LC.270.F.C4]
MNIRSTEKKINRRSIFAAIPALAATATAAHAFKMPDTPVQDDPKLPIWWERLVAEVECLREDVGLHFGHHEFHAITEDRLNSIFSVLDEAQGGLV